MRKEINVHIEARDRVTSAYLIAISAIVSAAFSELSFDLALLAAPPISFGFVIRYYYHHSIIGQIASYLKDELRKSASIDEVETVVQWDNSKAHNEYFPRVLNFYNFGNAALFVLPSFGLMAFYFYQHKAELCSIKWIGLLGIELVFLVLLVITFIWAHQYRVKNP
jgi:hypothetical protein